ncbi:MAG TPA: hypothetical protein VEJ38_00930 [Candidatus Acidoferrales bacterium]|nr:hypothetical protein [Candidatus Acidoferrales bacterium]
MTSREIFDACYARYRRLRDWLADTTGAIRSVDFDSPLDGYQWRPDRARACEYLADFERIGRAALRRPDWRGRLKLFNAYFVGGADYRKSVQIVGVSEGTFDYWYREIKRALGAEFSRAGLFPPSRYFQARNARPQSEDRKSKRRSAPRRSRRSGRAPRAVKQLPQQGNSKVEGHQQDVLQEV